MTMAIIARGGRPEAWPMARSLVCTALLCGLAVAGCDASRLPAADADASAAEPACTACHGGPESIAPPKAVDGSTSTLHRGVGAHQTHLRASAIARAVTCESCHVVPKAVYDVDHIGAEDGRATVTLSTSWLPALATGTAAGVWDPKTTSCSNVACHGAALKTPGKHASPNWTLVDGSQRSCGSCHGAPPAAPHPASTKCEGCHAATAGPNGTIIGLDKHINGKVDVVLSATPDCTGCHGAPPAGKHPADDKCYTCHAKTVGPGNVLLADGLHLNGSKPADVHVVTGADCTACHGAPPGLTSHPIVASHPNVEKFPKVAQCELCHSKTVAADLVLVVGGPHRDGNKDVDDLQQKKCDTCHGAPPALATHPKMTKCGPCHAATVDEAGKLIVGGKHVNGAVDMILPTKCDACHGGDGSAAPPPDHNGAIDPMLPTVGAHQAHLKGDVYSGGGITCEACHVLPESVQTEGHILGTLQTVLFPDGLGTAKGAQPAYDSAALTCSGVYCHGSKLDGGSVVAPKWTNTELACDACHAVPPSTDGGHPEVAKGDVTKCSGCHKKTMKPDGTINVDGGFHINGKVDP